jgi:hypothetical protein
MRRVPLFPRSLRVDDVAHFIDLRSLAFVFLPFRWDRAGDRLPHHPPVHAVLLG